VMATLSGRMALDMGAWFQKVARLGQLIRQG